MKFLCDEMLARLSRWLRAAGYDTRIAADGLEDRALLETAAAEGRIVLTRDRELAGRGGAPVQVVLLTRDGLPAQAHELSRRLAVDWLHDPFTRCVVDNAPLRAATPGEQATAPPKARALGGTFQFCPACGRLYWQGSHHRRMARRLGSWRAARRTPGPGTET